MTAKKNYNSEKQRQIGSRTQHESICDDISKSNLPSISECLTERPDLNPFKSLHLRDLFTYRDKERHKAKIERERQRHLKIHEKNPISQTAKFRKDAIINGAKEEAELLEKERDRRKMKNDYSKLILEQLDRPLDKEPLDEYINKKREMFMVQYSIGVKNAEIKHLEQLAAAEEKKLEIAEQCLEQDAALFDEFLKENDRNSVQAIALAEQKTKRRIQLADDIKQINGQILQIKADINKYEEKLKDYKIYKQFLEELVPEPHRSERKAKHEERKRQKRLERKDLLEAEEKKAYQKKLKLPALDFESKRETFTRPKGEKSLTDDEEFDSEPDLYFTHPEDVLNLFTELEEANLSLIQNCQEAEENFESMKNAIRKTKETADKETKQLVAQINRLQTSIEQEEAKTQLLEDQTKIVNFGDQNIEEQRIILEEMNKAIGSVYQDCIHPDSGSLGSIQMLTEIENKLESLFKTLELLPQDEVEAAQREKEIERRTLAREEKKAQQKIQQEERIRKALERAKAAPKKPIGRRIMARSEPVGIRQSMEDKVDKYNKEDEELAYFFT